jgi:hypothetical protein
VTHTGQWSLLRMSMQHRTAVQPRLSAHAGRECDSTRSQ